MILECFKKSTITILVVYEVVIMIINYLDDSNYSSFDEDEVEDKGILDDFIYQTIFNLVHT